VNSSSNNLPIHFFTIVLNGQPFIRYHLDIFRRLPFRWHWHVIEGVADLKHDTAWSVPFGGKVTETLHRKGLSRDGTTEYLDQLAASMSGQITIYRKPEGSFWDGKLEMVNAPLANIPEECLLWQIDADELWTVDQICVAHDLFLENPSKTSAFYYCHYFVGNELVTTSRNTYGNQSGEWLRTWRFRPGYRWNSHEPPQLCAPVSNEKWIDVGRSQPLTREETEAKGLVFQHFAYVTEEQLRFKEVYYGYRDALKQWNRLQSCNQFPVLLKNYFPWVQDETQVGHVSDGNFVPLARENGLRWEFEEYDFVPSQVKKVLWVRTDAIGDNVLSVAMLPLIQQKFPNASITVICQKQSEWLYRACPSVKSVEVFDRDQAYRDENYRMQMIQRLKEEKFDVAMNSVYSREPLTDMITIGSQAKSRIAFDSHHCNLMTLASRDDCNKFYTKLIPGGAAHAPELSRHADFLRSIGIAPRELMPKVWLSNDDESYADECFRKEGFDSQKTIILFAGSQWQEKIYSRYGEALSVLCQENGFSIIAVGTASEYEINQNNLNATGVRSLNLCGKATLGQAAALVKRCRLAVGADSAMAHLACAVGTPNVVLLGGGHFGRFFPYSELTSVVCLPLECYGCSWSCKYSTPHCTQDIDPKVVEEAARQTLAKKSSKPRIFIQGDSLWHPKNGEPQWKQFSEFLDLSAVEIIPVGNVSVEENQVISEEYWMQVGRVLKNINDLRKSGNLDKAKKTLVQAMEKFPRAIHLNKLEAELNLPAAK
jgi:ADP-heptose:LPS heptosyltransferase